MSKKVIDTVETLKLKMQENAEVIKDSEVHAAQKGSDAVKNINLKTENARKDIQNGYHEIAQDIQITAKNSSKEFNKPVK